MISNSASEVERSLLLSDIEAIQEKINRLESKMDWQKRKKDQLEEDYEELKSSLGGVY